MGVTASKPNTGAKAPMVAVNANVKRLEEGASAEANTVVSVLPEEGQTGGRRHRRQTARRGNKHKSHHRKSRRQQ